MPRVNYLNQSIMENFEKLPTNFKSAILKSYAMQNIESIILKIDRPSRLFLKNIILWSLENEDIINAKNAKNKTDNLWAYLD